ncbi:MAG: MarR family transcriptional regulator [Gammaproteobacteria bacterium]
MRSKNNGNADAAADQIAAECLAVRVRLLNRTITGIYDDALRPFGLTAGQLSILAAVARQDPISPRDIAQRLNMEKSTVSRSIDRMRRNGWLIVARAESGRGQRLTLSKKGRNLLEKSLPGWEKAQTKARALLGRRGAASIYQVGNAVWARLGRD